MSRPQTFDPKLEFSNRLTRIEAGGLNTNRTLFVGMEDMLVCPPGTFSKKRKKRGRVMPLFLTLLGASGAVFLMTMGSSTFY
ncbi:MAG: hypothetical protein RLZZ563_2165 [Pseudomonadota bacterium]|jgi:hypothetical protein